MAVTETIAFSVSTTSGLTSMSGYDNESGNYEANLPNQGFVANSVQQSFSLAFNSAAAQLVFMVASQNCTIQTNGTNTADVQTITITGTPTGGNFAIAFNGQPTVLPYSANASQVQTALQALSNIGAGNITCTGGPLPGTAVVCTFSGSMNTGQQPVFTAYSGALTGGTSPTVTVTHTTPGLPTNTINLVAGIPLVWGNSAGYSNCPFNTSIPVTQAFLTCTPSTVLNVRVMTK